MANTTNIGFKHISGYAFKNRINKGEIELGALYFVFTDPEDLNLYDYSRAIEKDSDDGKILTVETPTPVKGGQIWVKKSMPFDKTKYVNADIPQWFLCTSGVSNTSSINPDVIEQTLAVVIKEGDPTARILYLTNKQ